MAPDPILNQLRPCTILVVDDDRQICDILAESLAGMGHSVRQANDGQEAVELLNGLGFEIVITDMDMPRMDGMELIRYIVDNKHGTDIIAITGHTMRYKYTDVVSAGAADFISKPFTLNELEAKLSRLIRERQLRQELERLAIRDPLTGLYNRRFFEETIRKEAIRAIRYNHPLYLFFLDIDHFKAFNDHRGHQAGDLVLIRLGEVLKSSIREDVDSAFRYGGDEFTILLPHLQGDQALVVAERIRCKYNELKLSPTSLSVGIARFRRGAGGIDEDVADMIRRSDAALYRAKGDLGGDGTALDEQSA